MTSPALSYRATFILDTRGREETVDALIDGIKSELSAIPASVGQVQNHGQRDFARVTDRQLTRSVYVTLDVSGPASLPAAIRERFRLNKTVYRVLVQSIPPA